MALKNKDFVVFGLGKFGRSVAETLASHGYDVLAIDKEEEIIQDISDNVTHAVQADVTDIDALESLGVRNFDVAVIAIAGDMEASVMSTILCKEMGIKTVIAKAQNPVHKRVLEKIGADKIIFPEKEMGIRIANSLITKNFVDFIEISDDYSIIEIGVLPEWENKSIREIDLRAKYGINIMAIRREDSIDVTPQPDKELEEGDVLVVIGANDSLRRLNERKAKNNGDKPSK